MSRAPADGALLAPRRRPRVLEEYAEPSDRSARVYAVRRLADGSWDCDCPDWLYRRHFLDEDCKHIARRR